MLKVNVIYLLLDVLLVRISQITEEWKKYWYHFNCLLSHVWLDLRFDTITATLCSEYYTRRGQSAMIVCTGPHSPRDCFTVVRPAAGWASPDWTCYHQAGTLTLTWVTCQLTQARRAWRDPDTGVSQSEGRIVIARPITVDWDLSISSKDIRRVWADPVPTDFAFLTVTDPTSIDNKYDTNKNKKLKIWINVLSTIYMNIVKIPLCLYSVNLS